MSSANLGPILIFASLTKVFFSQLPFIVTIFLLSAAMPRSVYSRNEIVTFFFARRIHDILFCSLETTLSGAGLFGRYNSSAETSEAAERKSTVVRLCVDEGLPSVILYFLWFVCRR